MDTENIYTELIIFGIDAVMLRVSCPLKQLKCSNVWGKNERDFSGTRGAQNSSFHFAIALKQFTFMALHCVEDIQEAASIKHSVAFSQQLDGDMEIKMKKQEESMKRQKLKS